MALSPARRHGNWMKWLVSLLVIIAVWRVGEYGVNWTSWYSVAGILVLIGVLVFAITFWKRKN